MFESRRDDRCLADDREPTTVDEGHDRGGHDLVVPRWIEKIWGFAPEVNQRS
jgi:hypothetical protein